ncbi:hypothetical protein FS749_010130 [Ceratobasidium sp. UAMH 11750]|nr:hypothetical protein FS749_010130 [Ceratobasidium sp. UAMH 11750]
MGLSKSANKSTLGICAPLPSLHGTPVPWMSTHASILQPIAPASPILQCQSVKIGDESTVSINNFVLVRFPTTPTGEAPHSDIGLAQILEILSECSTYAVLTVTVKPYDLSAPTLPYHFPTILPSQRDAFIPHILTPPRHEYLPNYTDRRHPHFYHRPVDAGVRA